MNEMVVNADARKNEVAADMDGLVLDFQAPAQQTYCSITPNSDKEVTDLYNLCNAPQHRLADAINKTIEIVGVYAETVWMVNESTGEKVPAPRIVLIDKNLEGYACVSTGIYSALTKIMALKGDARTWASPIKIQPFQITKGSGSSVRSILSLKLV